METWQEKRSVHTMNLRSVFTAEQQRILERYYDNGMTNQSKSCFQLILQCAQETKLDFSVVRTWVGNKRRKLASKADKNGVAGVSNHGLAVTGGALVPSSVLTAEMAAARGVQRAPGVAHLLPPPTSCPSSSSSPSSLSPLSSGSGANSADVIVTGTYSLPRGTGRLDSSSHGRAGAKAPPPHPEAEPGPGPHARPGVQPDAAPLHSAVAAHQRKAPPHVPTSAAPMFSQMRRSFPPRDPPVVPPGWAKQYGASQHQPWPPTSHQQTPAVLRSSPSSAPDSGVKIQQVFTIAGLAEGLQRPPAGTSQERGSRKPCSPGMSETFSIAMETADADDEYSREEELANMGAQIQLGRSTGSGAVESSRNLAGGLSLLDTRGMYTVASRSLSSVALHSPNSVQFGEKGCQTNSSLLLSTAPRGSYPFRLISQTSPSRPSNLKASSMAAPWLLSNSRKRTFQDRTQFTDVDLHTLKRYWDNGMTSLGSVCREKISAAATELNVDSEIVKTWIGNRRRKYRLMGIEIPPPKGGPATFPKVASTESLSPLTPEEDEPKTLKPPEDCEETLKPLEDCEIDAVSVCLSEDGASDSFLKDNDDGTDGSNSFAIADNVKIEIIDEEDDVDDDDDDDGDVMATDVEQLHSLLEYKHEEVQYLESELENQKQKYYELRTFTQSLVTALKNSDSDKQQELLANLPQQVEEDQGPSPDTDGHSSVEMASIQKDSSVSEGEGDTELL